MEDPLKSFQERARARFTSSLRHAGILFAGLLGTTFAVRVGGESFGLAVLGIFLGVAVGGLSSGMADTILETYRHLTKDDSGVRLVLVSVIGAVALFLFFYLISERLQRSVGSVLESFHEHPSYATKVGMTAVPSFLVTLWWLTRRRRTAISQMGSKEPGRRRNRN